MWKDILKEEKINLPKRVEMEGIDKEGLADVRNNFDVDGWPKYVVYDNRVKHFFINTFHFNPMNIYALYEYVSAGKYRIIPYKNFQLVEGLETEIDLHKDDAWAFFSDMMSKSQFIEARYKGMAVYTELDMGGALTIYRRKR
jgi:hypothetical protein